MLAQKFNSVFIAVNPEWVTVSIEDILFELKKKKNGIYLVKFSSVTDFNRCKICKAKS